MTSSCIRILLSLTLAALTTVSAAAQPEAERALTQGREAFHAGSFQEAREALEQARRASPDSTTLARIRHLLGLTALELGDHGEAIATLTSAIAFSTDSKVDEQGRSSLVDVLRFHLGHALAAVGRHDEAARAYAEVVEDPYSPHRAQAAFARARMLELGGDHKAALAAYRDFVDGWPASAEAREARVHGARLALEEGRTRSAMRALRAVVESAPLSRAGLEAQVMLTRSLPDGTQEEPPVGSSEELEELEWLLRERRFEDARQRIEARLAKAEKDRDRRGQLEALELLAKVLTQTRREGEALTVHQRRAALGGSVPSRLERARLLALAGDYEAGEKLFRSRYGTRSRMFWHGLGDFRFQFGRWKKAYEAYRKARRMRRGKRDREADAEEDVTPRMATALLAMGKTDKALYYLRNRRASGRREKLGVRYWHARGLQLAERRDDALAAFDELADEAPHEYYGILAHSRALEMRGEAPAPEEAARPGNTFWTAESLSPPFDQAPQVAPRDEQLRVLGALVAECGDTAREARRAQELAELGFVAEAREELLVVHADLRTLRRHGSWYLAGLGRNPLTDNRSVRRAPGGAGLRDGGRRDRKTARAFHRNRRAIKKALRTAQVALGSAYGNRRSVVESIRLGAAIEGDRLDAWRRAYPLAQPRLVEGFSRHHDVPPYFLYGIMMVESGFHPHPISVAHAYGMLQVIPRTGRRLASELGYHEFTPELLLQPEVSIYFGSAYLGALLRKYRGQELLAAAAYNGGPHRVDAWLRACPNRTIDMFVEAIPYRQTKGYVRSVLEKVARYRRIYNGEQHIYVSNRLDPDSSLHPNY